MVQSRYVFCSRHGEIGRTLSLLRGIAADEPLSPADFTMSVHNSIGGILSIATGNRAAQSAVAAGADSFCQGLIEALAELHRDPSTPIDLVYFEEATPAFLIGPCDRGERALALVLRLRLPAAGEACLRISMRPSRRHGMLSASEQAFTFLSFLQSGAPQMQNQGAHWIWEWRRDVA